MVRLTIENDDGNLISDEKDIVVTNSQGISKKFDDIKEAIRCMRQLKKEEQEKDS